MLTHQPERTKFYLLLWSLLPGTVMFISCIYMCVCRCLLSIHQQSILLHISSRMEIIFAKTPHDVKMITGRKYEIPAISFSPANLCSQVTMDTWGSFAVAKQSQVSNRGQWWRLQLKWLSNMMTKNMTITVHLRNHEAEEKSALLLFRDICLFTRMRIVIEKSFLTGIGEVAVYKPPGKNKS